MTASDKKKTAILVLLLAGAGFSWYRMYRPMTDAPADVATKAAPKTKPVKPGQQAAILIDLVQNTSAVPSGQINLFDYRQKPVPKTAETTRTVPQQQFVAPQPRQDTAPVLPPVQPWKAFRYEGFSVSKNGGKILASITEGGSTYEVKEGDCMKEVCVTRLTERDVELEDMQLKRKQTFPRIQVQ